MNKKAASTRGNRRRSSVKDLTVGKSGGVKGGDTKTTKTTTSSGRPTLSEIQVVKVVDATTP